VDKIDGPDGTGQAAHMGTPKQVSEYKQRNDLRHAIAHFCEVPRTMHEVRDKFKISGISAGAFLSGLCRSGACHYDSATKRHRHDKRYRVH